MKTREFKKEYHATVKQLEKMERIVAESKIRIGIPIIRYRIKLLNKRLKELDTIYSEQLKHDEPERHRQMMDWKLKFKNQNEDG